MSEYTKHVITANDVMIDYNKQQIKDLKAEQARLSKTHARHVFLSTIIRELNHDIYRLKEHSASVIAKE